MNILIAHDGSPASDPIAQDLQSGGLPSVGHAVVLCVAEQVPLATTLLPPGDFGGVGVVNLAAEPSIGTATQTAERAAAQIATLLPAWTVRAQAVRDHPAQAIIHHARSISADLIVVGSSGKGRLERWMLGSVSREVLSAAPYSVRVARPPRAGRDRGDEPLRILVGYDGSPDADRVVRTVAGRFWPQGTRVRLVTVVDEQILRAIPVTVTGTALAQERLGRVQQFLDDALRSLRDVGLEVSDKIEQGEPKRLLVEEAKTWQADSLFVGSRGLGRVARLLSGSVSTALADRAPCTVEVVRPRSAEAQGT